MIRTKRVLGLLSPLLMLIVLVFLWLNRWNIYDAWRLRDYTPPARIAQLATDTTMSDRSRHIFYVYRPELDDKTAFNSHCSNSERTIVLGCYVSGRGIYLYNVTDPRLQGIIEVTSAHEMLHAAYERLGKSEKEKLSKQLNLAFQEVKIQRIKENIEDYRKNGADVTNELHSILGTEVRDLPPELEQYYARYFNNRLAVVAFSEKYEQAFTQRKQQVEAADQQLTALKRQIDESQELLASIKENLDAQRAQLDSLLAAKQYEQYNSGVPGFNAQVNNFNAQVRNISRLIDQYNALVAQRNAIAIEEGELVKAIDSRPTTIDHQ